MTRRLFLAGLIIYIFCLPINAQLQLNIFNLIPKKSTLRIAVFDSEEKFLGSDILKSFVIPLEKDSMFVITINDLSVGYYAISVYQDINNNGVLDKKLFGQPAEPYGFSGNSRNMFRPPAYNESKFNYSPGMDLRIELVIP
jgi:uncharacterized protein (DUF2141 family)